MLVSIDKTVFFLTVNVRVGAKDYSADVLVGTTTGNHMVLYDVVDFKPIEISKKKRTDTWLTANRLQLPLAVTKYGPIKSVTYPNGNVNTYSMQGNKNNAQGKQSFSVSGGLFDSIVHAGENSGKAQGEDVRFENFKRASEKLGFRVVEAPNTDVLSAAGNRVQVDGYVDFDNREVYINPNAKNKEAVLLKHELTHILQDTSDKYLAKVKNYIKAELPGVWDETYRQVADKYARLETVSNIRGTKAVLEAETMAEIASTLATDSAINQYGGDVSFGRNVALWFSYMAKRVKAVFSNLTDAEKLEIAARKWEKALKKAENGKQSGNGVMFDATYDFKHQVEDALGRKMKSGLSVYVGRTPNLLAKCGLSPDLPMLMNQSHMRDANHEKDANNPHYHGIDKDIIKQLPELLKNPVMIYDSISSDNWENSVCVVTNKFDSDGNPIIVSIRANSDGSNRYLDVSFQPVSVDKSNFVTSVYGKDNFLVHMESILDNDAILYANKQKTLKLFSDSGLQLPTRLNSLGFDTIIHQSHNIVNNHFMQDGKNYAGSFNFSVSENASGEPAAETQQNIAETQQDAWQAENRRRSVDAIEAELDDIAERLGREDLSAEEEDALLSRQLKLEAKLRARKRVREKEIDRINDAQARRTVGDNLSDTDGGLPAAQLARYRETKDAGDLPTRAAAVLSKKNYENAARGYAREIADIQNILHAKKALDAGAREENITLSSNEDLELAKAMSPEDEVVLRRRLDELSDKWRRALKRAQLENEIIDELKEVDSAARPNHRWIDDISEDLQDKSNVLKYGTYGMNDFGRNIKHFFGKYYDLAYEKILKPLYNSKARYAEGVSHYSDRIYHEVVCGLGIKKGSKLSAAVQWLGEGEKPIANKKGADLAPYTYEDCVAEFGEETAKKIKQATEIFRSCYDELLDGINETRRMLYPNNPDKLIKKRKDYFRHFTEMNEGFRGLGNILGNDQIGIDPMLVGVSETTRPKSKWQSFAQERFGSHTEYDAVGGFLEYLPNAMYAIHIDPNIVNIRSLAYDLASAKASEGAQFTDESGEVHYSGNSNANGFIRYLQRYANHLAGKTVSHFDRWLADKPGGRKAIRVLSLINNRVKSNAILGNVSSVVSQLANMINMHGKIQKESDITKGVIKTIQGFFGNKAVQDNYSRSAFLKERFLSKKEERFDSNLSPKKWAVKFLGLADELGTRVTWNAAFHEAVRLGKADPFQYADDLTRECVAGRGIGELPLMFQSQLAKLALPFRVEVMNNMNVLQDVLFDEGMGERSGGVVREGMSDEERYHVLANKRIKNVPKVNAEKLESFSAIGDAYRMKETERKKLFVKIGEEFGVFKNYTNEDVELSFAFSKRRMRESEQHQKGNYEAFVKMLSCFDDVIDRAVGIEVHNRNDEGYKVDASLEEMYVLVSAFEDGEAIVPVKLEIKEFKDKENMLYLAVALDSIKKNEVVKQGNTKNSVTQGSRSFNISLSQLLKNINPKDENFIKYIPKQFFEKGAGSNTSGGNVGHNLWQFSKLMVMSTIVNTIIGALKNDEFNPEDDIEKGFSEGENVWERIGLSLKELGLDWVDGYGSGVAFDPIHDIASGIYQGISEGEDPWEKAGLSMLRPMQNMAGDLISNHPLGTAALGIVGVDNETAKTLFNDKVYLSGGLGMPAASSVSGAVKKAAKGDLASAGAEAIKSFALPWGGSQLDKSVRGLFEFANGANTKNAYERMAGKDGTLKYLVEPSAENVLKSVLFGPSAFSGASDEYYNNPARKMSKEETDQVLSQTGYAARKATLEDLVNVHQYNQSKDARMEEAEKTFLNETEAGSVLYEMYQNGETDVVPYRNMPLDLKMTVDKVKYEKTISPDEATALSEELSDRLTERFRELDKAPEFEKLTVETREKVLSGFVDLERDYVKAEYFHENGDMTDENFAEYEMGYLRNIAKKERDLYVDSPESFVAYNAADVGKQYLQYGDNVTEETRRQVKKYVEHAQVREPDAVDMELLRLSNESGTDIDVFGNVSSVLSYSKDKQEYYIDMPDTEVYAFIDLVDRSCRAALAKVFNSGEYQRASVSAKKEIVAKVKREVRADIKEQYKRKYPSVKIDMLDALTKIK